MLRKIFHHRLSPKDDACAKVCCTRIEGFGVKAGDLTIFENVNIHIHCGELTALIGPNGAGKSTLLKAILGEVEHVGKLHYVDAKGLHTGHPVIGYVPQYLNFDLSTPASVMDLFTACFTQRPVWLFGARKFRRRVLANLQRVKAQHLADRRLGALSGGEMQRVLLALALDPAPDLLLLDEPVSGVDQNGMALFYEIVSELRKRHDMAILLISHDLALVERHADQVILLDKKVLCSGPPEKVFDDPTTKRLFGADVFLDRKGGKGHD